jgi:hypothetical protein
MRNHGNSPPPEHQPERSAIARTMHVVAGAALVGLGVPAVAAVYELLATPASKARLLRLRGSAHVPEVAAGEGWRDTLDVQVEGLSADERGILAASWLAVARLEHASITAYTQLGLRLAALAAPSELVAGTHRAALAELAQARRCFGLASIYAGKPLGAGPITQLARPEHTPGTFPRLAVATLVKGCLTSSVAAAVASTSMRTASDPAVQSALTLIAAGEMQHAELAWEILAWARAMGGDPARDALRARVAQLGDELAPRAQDLSGIDRARLATHGFLDQDMLGAMVLRLVDKVQERAARVGR